MVNILENGEMLCACDTCVGCAFESSFLILVSSPCRYQLSINGKWIISSSKRAFVTVEVKPFQTDIFGRNFLQLKVWAFIVRRTLSGMCVRVFEELGRNACKLAENTAFSQPMEDSLYSQFSIGSDCNGHGILVNSTLNDDNRIYRLGNRAYLHDCSLRRCVPIVSFQICNLQGPTQ